MAVIFNGDFETGDQSQWNGYADALAHPDASGRIRFLTHNGYKWSSLATAQGWTARYPLNETVGTTATDTIGAKNGTYTGGFTLNQTGTVAEAGTKSVLLNGTTGFVDLGANGVDLSSGSWGFMCLVKPSALGAAHRGLFGGATGSYCASLFNGELNVGVVGGGNLQIPTFSRPASLNLWNLIGISYNASTDQITRFIAASNILYNNTGPFAVSNTLVPIAGVKVNQIGKRDAGGFFQGNLQEPLFIKGSELTEIMFLTYWYEAISRAADKGTIVTPSAGTTQRGMIRVNVNPASFAPTPPSYDHDFAELHHSAHPNPVGKTEYWSFALRFPSDSNWGTTFYPIVEPKGWMTWGQMGYNGYTAASIMLEADPPGDDGVSGPRLHVRMQGGLTVAGAKPNDVNYINKLAGNGWNTHHPAAAVISQANIRFPQILGPNTFLNAGSHPWAYDVWHEFIFKILWATNTFTGSIEVWHRQRGGGASFSAASSKVYETFGRQNYQYAAGDNVAGFACLHKFGGYCGRTNATIEFFEDQIACATTFAEAEAKFPAETVSAIQLEQKTFRGRNDDGNEATATWKAAENANWTQDTNQLFRVRFEIQETAGFAGATGAPQLQYNRNGSGWVNVTSVSSVVRSADSPAVVDSAATTNQLSAGTGTFVSGFFDDVNGLVSTVSLPASGHSEWEFAMQILDSDVVNGDIVQLRMTFPNDPAPAYTQIPSLITRSGATPPADAYRDLIVAAAPNVISYWRLDDTTTVLDDIVGSGDGTYLGGYLQSQTGIPGTVLKLAVDFNGSSGYAEVPHNSTLNLGNGPLTIEAWVKRDSTGTLDTICSKGAGAYCLEIGTDNKIHFGPPGGTDIFVTTATLTDTANWHLVTLTYGGGSDVNLYLDGLDKAGTKNTAVLANNTLPLRIGAR